MKMPEKQAHAIGEIACDEALFETLRTLRKQLADDRSVPPYIIFSDVSLRQMARFYPANNAEFTRISGVGQRKLQEFGDRFMAEIATHLRSNPKQIFAEDAFGAPAPRTARLNDTTRETLKMFRSGMSVKDIARQRALVASTIYGHLAAAIEIGEKIDLSQLLSIDEQNAICGAFTKAGFGDLTGVHESLGGRFDFGLLRVCRAAQQRSA
jgi:ATP-dependent DNA helicase RecQ